MDSSRIQSSQILAREFVYTAERAKIVLWVSIAPTIAALIGSLVVLVLAFLIWLRPVSRKSLQRQSLQMLLWVQVMSLIYNATFLGEVLITGPTPWCNFIDFVVMLIPVNLQLALVHGIRTEGWMRYYLIGSFLAAVATAIPGAVKDVWGWDPLSLICWISITDIRERNSWEVGSFYAWLITSMVIATFSTLVVIVHLARYAYRRDRKFSLTGGTGSSSGAIVRALSWRITLYPFILIVNNCISAAANFAISGTGGIESESTFIIWCMSQFFYGALPLFYALVSIFVDPSFSRAVRDLVTGRAPTNSWTQSVEMSTHRRATTIQVELSRQIITDTGEALDDYPIQDVIATATFQLPKNTRNRDVERDAETDGEGDGKDSGVVGEGESEYVVSGMDGEGDMDEDGKGQKVTRIKIQAGVGRDGNAPMGMSMRGGRGEARGELTDAMQRRIQEARDNLRADLNQL